MLDNVDKKILNLLKQDSSLSTHKISKKTLIPQTTVLNRIIKLKKAGIIKRFTIDLDYKKLDKGTKALIFVKVETKLEKKSLGKIGTIEKNLSQHEPVLNVKRLMGKWDFVIEIVCKDIDEINNFLIESVRSNNAIVDTETVVVLNEWDGY